MRKVGARTPWLRALQVGVRAGMPWSTGVPPTLVVVWRSQEGRVGCRGSMLEAGNLRASHCREAQSRLGLLPETHQVLVHVTTGCGQQGCPCWLGFGQGLQGHPECFRFLGFLALPQVMVILGVEPRHVPSEGV